MSGAHLDVEEFLRRWHPSGGSERADFQQFAVEPTQPLGGDAPKPATPDSHKDDYHHERPVTFIHTDTQSRGVVYPYRRNRLLREAEQGTSKGRQSGAVGSPLRIRKACQDG